MKTALEQTKGVHPILEPKRENGAAFQMLHLLVLTLLLIV